MSDFMVGQQVYPASVSFHPFALSVEASRRRSVVALAGRDDDGLQILVLDDGMRLPAACAVDADAHDHQSTRIRAIRDALEISLADARKANDICRAGVCPNPLVAAFYVYATGLAIHIKGGPEARHEWRMRYALSRADEAVERDPSLRFIRDIEAPPAFAPGA